MRILGDAVQEHRGFQTEKSWASHQQRFVARYAIGVAQPSFRYCAKSATHPAKKGVTSGRKDRGLRLSRSRVQGSLRALMSLGACREWPYGVALIWAIYTPPKPSGVLPEH